MTWRDLAPKTIQTRDTEYRLRIDPAFGHLPIDRITVVAVTTWIDDLRNQHGEITRSIEKSAECLRTMLNVVIDAELIDRNPVRSIPRAPRSSSRRRGRRVLSAEQYVILQNASKTLFERTLVRVATEACLRQGELCALRWSDIDFNANRLHVHSALTQTRDGGRVLKLRKGDHPARPVLTDSLTALLRAFQVEAVVELGAGPNDPVWPGRGPRTGKHIHGAMMASDAMGKFVVKLIVRAGLVDARGKHIASLHDLRRTGASLFASQGAPERVIQDQLGHTRGSRVTHEHYIESTDDALRDGWVSGAFE